MLRHAGAVAVAVGQVLGAVELAEIEVDGGVEQRLGVTGLHPVEKAILPFIGRETQFRIAGHDIALAQRKAAIGQTPIHGLGKRQEGRTHRLGRFPAGGEHQTVVLIGR